MLIFVHKATGFLFYLHNTKKCILLVTIYILSTFLLHHGTIYISFMIAFFYLIMLEVLHIRYLSHLSRILSWHAFVYCHLKRIHRVKYCLWWYFESWINPEFMLLVRKMVNKHKNERCMMVMHDSDVISDYSLVLKN